MAVRAPRVLAKTGTAPVEYAASAGGDTITNNKVGALSVRVRNASGAGIDVTVASPGKCSQGGTHPLVVNVPAGATREIGPLEAKRFTTNVALTYSAFANLFIDPVLVPGG